MEENIEKIYQHWYCKEKDCDFMIALFSIFEKNKYLIKFKSFNNGEITINLFIEKTFREREELAGE